MGWIEGCCVKSFCRSLQSQPPSLPSPWDSATVWQPVLKYLGLPACLSKRFVPPNKVAKPIREQGWVLLGTKKLIPQTPRLPGYGLMQQISKPPGKSLCPLAGPGSGAGRGRCWWTRCWSASLLLFPSKQAPQAALGCHPFHLSCLGSFLGPWQESKHRIAVWHRVVQSCVKNSKGIGTSAVRVCQPARTQTSCLFCSTPLYCFADQQILLWQTKLSSTPKPPKHPHLEKAPCSQVHNLGSVTREAILQKKKKLWVGGPTKTQGLGAVLPKTNNDILCPAPPCIWKTLSHPTAKIQ